MTTKAVEPVEADTEVIQPLFWMGTPIKLPVFMVESPKEFPAIEATGHNHYYVLAPFSHTFKPEGNTTNVTFKGIRMWRIGHSIMGRSVAPVFPDDVGLKGGLNIDFESFLPRIPYVMHLKMDKFFREVHEELHTEAIVLLTYDWDMYGAPDPTSGWGFCVPEQVNSSAHCKYTPEGMELIATTLPENTILVGTAHSHPLMGNAPSETDRKDMAGFPGIHLIYGWTKDGPSQVHVDFVYSGTTWHFQVADVMDTVAPAPEVAYPDLEEHVKLVTKEVVTTTTTYGNGHHSQWQGVGGGTGVGKQTGSKSPSVASSILVLTTVPKFPEGSPDPTKTTIIGLIHDINAPACPFCQGPISEIELLLHRCYACLQWVSEYPDLKQIAKDRLKLNAQAKDLLDPKKGEYPIVFMDTTQIKEEDVFTADKRTAAAKK